MRLFIATIILIIGSFSYSQSNDIFRRSLKLGAAYSAGKPPILGRKPYYFYEDAQGNEKELPSYDHSYTGGGLYVLYPILKWIDAEVGLEYKAYKYVFKTSSQFTDRYQGLVIPLGLRIYFLKFFFVNGGISYNFDSYNKTNEVARESNYNTSYKYYFLGFGFKYDFKNGITPFLNYYANLFDSSGFRLGITYTFKPRNKSKSSTKILPN